jgi:thiol-disulfide isomerase/thioredoxin
VPKILLGLAALIIGFATFLALTPDYAGRDNAPVSTDSCHAAAEKFANFNAKSAGKPVQADGITDESGKRIDFSQYRGKAIVLNFWATWCGPCVREMPSLLRLKYKIAGAGVEVLPVSEDVNGAAKVVEFYKAHRLGGFPVLMDEGGKLARSSKVPGLPTTILINREGIETGRVVGPLEWDSAAAIKLIKVCTR